MKLKDSLSIIGYPLNTEKAVRITEMENKLVFVVDRKATKEKIKKAVEDAFKVKVEKVNTFISNKGKKKAYVQLNFDTPAMDIITKLGLM